MGALKCSSQVPIFLHFLHKLRSSLGLANRGKDQGNPVKCFGCLSVPLALYNCLPHCWENPKTHTRIHLDPWYPRQTTLISLPSVQRFFTISHIQSRDWSDCSITMLLCILLLCCTITDHIPAALREKIRSNIGFVLGRRWCYWWFIQICCGHQPKRLWANLWLDMNSFPLGHRGWNLQVSTSGRIPNQTDNKTRFFWKKLSHMASWVEYEQDP